MRFLRGIVSGLFFVAYGAAGLAFALALCLPGWKARHVRAVVRGFYRLFLWTARCVRLFRVDFDEATRAALASCRGKVVVMNHLSLIDICVVMALLPDSSAVAKAAAKRNPFLGAFVRRALIANDEDPAKAVAAAAALLKDGVSVIVFPQGTRGGKRFHRGAARMALAAGAPVCAFRIAYDPLPLAKNQPWWDVGNRQIMVQLTYSGEVGACGANDHRHAVALTERIKEMIG